MAFACTGKPYKMRGTIGETSRWSWRSGKAAAADIGGFTPRCSAGRNMSGHKREGRM